MQVTENQTWLGALSITHLYQLLVAISLKNRNVNLSNQPEPTFMTSSRSSSQRTKTEEEGDRGREVEREDTSWARRRALAALDDEALVFWTFDW